MYFNAHCEVFIGGKQLYTVVSVEVQNDCKQLGANCEISVPLTCRIQNEKQDLIQPVQNVFKSGDKVEIYAWYEDYEKLKIFDGWLWDFVEGNPLKIRCLDWVYWLRKPNFDKSFVGKKRFKNVVKDILALTKTEVAKKTDIKLELFEKYQKGNELLQDLFLDFEVHNLSFTNMSPAAMLEDIKKKLMLTMSLIDNKLYCNLCSFTLNTVKLQSDVNVIGVSMQKPDAAFQNVKVKKYLKNKNGKKEEVEIGDAYGETHEVYMYCIDYKDNKTQQQLHDNALEQVKQGHYSGKVETLLYPVSNLFDAIDYTDIRFPERSGIYTVRAINITLDRNGFHRELTLAYLRAK